MRNDVLVLYEEELTATKLVMSMLKDDDIRPRGESRSFKPWRGGASAPVPPAEFFVSAISDIGLGEKTSR